MAILFYIGSIITALGTLIMTIFLTFTEEEAEIHKFFGEKEIIICTIIAFAFMAVGFLTDYKGRGF